MKNLHNEQVGNDSQSTSNITDHSLPLVYVLILNFQSLSDTIACVESVLKSDYANIRILVMDNASPDGSGARLAELFDQDMFLQIATNEGYAGGNNIGMNIALNADADYVFILNPDVRVECDTISACVHAAESDDSIAAINPIQLSQETDLIDSKFLNAILKPSGFSNPTYRRDGYPATAPVKELLGAALFMTTRSIKRVGGFDPLYFAYGEETDLCRRFCYHGYKLMVIGTSPVRHLRTKETMGASDRILFLRLKGIYLGLLKDPYRSFKRSLRLFARQFLQELLGKRRNEYPFNQYPVTRVHCLRAFFWILTNLFSIRRHRRLEQLGRAHV